MRQKSLPGHFHKIPSEVNALMITHKLVIEEGKARHVPGSATGWRVMLLKLHGPLVVVYNKSLPQASWEKCNNQG